MKKAIYSITLNTRWRDGYQECLSWLQGYSPEGEYINLNSESICRKTIRQDLYELLQYKDWLIVSPFTTYKHYHVIVLTLDADLAALVEKEFAYARYDSALSSEIVFDGCRSASFDDYKTESLLITEMLETFGGKALLLCEAWEGMEEEYEPWFPPSSADRRFYKARDVVKSLSAEESFTIDSSRLHWSLYQVSDIEVLHALFANIGNDYNYSPQLLAADTDIKQLKALLEKDFDPCPVAPDKLPGSWWYSHIYGGGSDEYHGVFSARDARLTQWVWQAAGKDAFSLF